jgi:diguanylate cyclase (GGDEF)-like protein
MRLMRNAMRSRTADYPRVNLGIALFCIALVVLICAAAAHRTNFEREEAIDGAIKENSNLAMAFEEQTVRTFRAAEQVAVFVRHQYGEAGAAMDLRKYIENGVIREQIFTIISVVNEHGDIVLSSMPGARINYADRDFFRFHQRAHDDKLFISKPVLGRVSGTWQVPMSIRIAKPDGAFGGVVVLSVDPAYFIAFYKKADLGHAGVVSLEGLDGIARVRYAGEKAVYGQEVSDGASFDARGTKPVGSYVATDPLDGVARIFAYRAIEGYPLTAVVGTSVEEALAPHRTRQKIRLVVAMLASLVIVAFALYVMRDIAGRKELENRLTHQASHDSLTQLPNRALFHDRLELFLAQARRRKRSVALLFVDLDRFKTVNDTLGHASGDALLLETAKRLRECVRESDTVGRFGGDEFAVILSDLKNINDARRLAQKIIEAISRPLILKEQEIVIGASVGMACYPADAGDAGSLLRNADVAMLRAKQLGRRNVQHYDPSMTEPALDKLSLENDLRRALEREEFRLHFQPKACLKTGQLTGLEALLRWERPGKGLVPPAEFIPLLEETGLIVDVGMWVLQAACSHLRAWKDKGLPALPVAVNLSAKQFQRYDISAAIERTLLSNGIDAGLLEVELTESELVRNAEEVAAVLAKLRAARIRVTVDDFGTGYSSLAYLKRFPLDALKLDRSFVRGLPNNAEDVSIAKAVISMAHSLGLKVVAEGVETEAQRDFLSQHACDEFQGYLLSRPLPAAECERLLGLSGSCA